MRRSSSLKISLCRRHATRAAGDCGRTYAMKVQKKSQLEAAFGEIWETLAIVERKLMASLQGRSPEVRITAATLVSESTVVTTSRKRPCSDANGRP